MTHKRVISPAMCWMVTIVCGLCVTSLWASQPGEHSEAEQHFEKANALHQGSDYERAIAEYRAVMNAAPNTAIAQNAHYWIGQIQYEMRQFDAALATFREIVERYPTSTVVATTEVMIERVQQAMRNRALFEAVKKADVEQVKLLITEGADVDAKWGDTNTKEEQEKAKARDADATPLCYAVDANNMDLIKLLVEAGTDVNTGQWPPLCQAVDENNMAIAEYLLDHGANVNYPKFWAPLQYAPYVNDNIEMVKLLIDRGANLNVLEIAWSAMRRDIFDLLIERGADVNAQGAWGSAPLHFAVVNDDPEFINILIAQGADVNLKDTEGRTPLHWAVDTRLRRPVDRVDAGIVKLLLDKGADVNAKEYESGFTALHHAARLGKTNVAELLIARGADINAKDKEGHTPLYVAANHDYEVAELLIDKGADSSIQTDAGKTLLQLAQERKQIESMVPDMVFTGDPNSGFSTRIVCGDIDGDGYDDVLIGGYKYNSYRGCVYLFYGGPDLDTAADLILEGQNEGDWFGNSIACGDIDNDGYEDIVIGAGLASEKQGRAYLYWGSDRESMDADPDKILVGEQERGAQFGAGHSAVYDIDNDGYDDIILGACRSRGGTGRAYLYYGNTKESIDTAHDLIFSGEDGRDRFFGYTISCGDVNSDGFGDIVIAGYTDRGQAYLYNGSSKSRMDAKAEVVYKVQSEDSDYFGRDIVCVDRNGDSYDDVAIGARGYNDSQGRIYFFRGSSKRSLDVDPDMVLDGEIRGSNYGIQEVCGDIDGDNVKDLVIGASGFRQQAGRVYVYWGKDLAAPGLRPGRVITGEHPNDEFGYELACGDVNNDGFDDLLVGAPGYKDKDGTNQGRAYLYYGGPKNK